MDILQVLGLRFQVGRPAGFDVPQGLFFGSAGFDSQWRAKTSSRYTVCIDRSRSGTVIRADTGLHV